MREISGLGAANLALSWAVVTLHAVSGESESSQCSQSDAVMTNSYARILFRVDARDDIIPPRPLRRLNGDIHRAFGQPSELFVVCFGESVPRKT